MPFFFFFFFFGVSVSSAAASDSTSTAVGGKNFWSFLICLAHALLPEKTVDFTSMLDMHWNWSL